LRCDFVCVVEIETKEEKSKKSETQEETKNQETLSIVFQNSEFE